MEEISKKIKGLLISGVSLFIVFGIFPANTKAASLYFSPSSGLYKLGTTFSVGVYVSSTDQAMNTAAGVILFPSDKLEVVSISKTGSIFSLWIQEPSFSNSAGTVNFEGVILNPGFTGSSGKTITIAFRTKVAGNAPLIFSSVSVLANDGKGTNILTELGDANFSIDQVQPGAPEIITPTEVVGLPEAPEINSATHPDPNKWYAKNNVEFNWNVPKDVIAVRLSVGRISQAIPTITHIPPINLKEVKNLEDGIWYFSIRFKNNVGWGGISHFRFQIDTEKPTNFNITEIERKDLTDPSVKFTFDANDKTSGVDHYEIQIDNNDSKVWQDDGSNIYITPVLSPGKHTLIAKAVDKAGNSLANFVDFTIEALEAPTVTEYPKELQSGETFIMKGKTKYPNAQINIWLQHEKNDPKNYLVKSDQDGNFIFVADDRLSSGVYAVWTDVMDARGAKSNLSEKITVSVGQLAFLKIGSWAVKFLAVIIPLVILIFVLLFIIWYVWHRFWLFRKKLVKIKKEVREAELALHKAFDSLKENIREQIKMLEKTRIKRQLTEEEEKIIKQFRKDLNGAERFIGKEIEDIKKEIKYNTSSNSITPPH